MKTLLALTALFAVALSAGAALIETFGFAVPPVASAEIGLGLFVAAFAALLFSSAYAEPRMLGARGERNVRLLPATEAFAAGRVNVSARRIHCPSTATAAC